MDSSNLSSSTTSSANNPTDSTLKDVPPPVSTPGNKTKHKLILKLSYLLIVFLLALSVFMGFEIAKKDFGTELSGSHGEPEGDPVITVTLNSVSQSQDEVILYTEHKGKQYPPIKLSSDSKVLIVNSNDERIRLASIADLKAAQEINIFLTDRSVKPFIANRVYIHE